MQSSAVGLGRRHFPVLRRAAAAARSGGWKKNLSLLAYNHEAPVLQVFQLSQKISVTSTPAQNVENFLNLFQSDLAPLACFSCRGSWRRDPPPWEGWVCNLSACFCHFLQKRNNQSFKTRARPLQRKFGNFFISCIPRPVRPQSTFNAKVDKKFLWSSLGFFNEILSLPDLKMLHIHAKIAWLFPYSSLEPLSYEGF